MKFDSLLDYPEHARRLVKKKLKERHGIDMEDHSIDGVICEFMIGMREIGYTSIELNSVPVVY